MTSYLVMIYENEAKWADAEESVIQENTKKHGLFAQANGNAIRGGARLSGREAATSIRSNGNGGFSTTDGTFVETKEVLGGFYIIEAADLDEALAMARQVPAPFGGIEVRPIVPS